MKTGMYNLDDTIVAISSGTQRVPVGIIRISGQLSSHIMNRIFQPLSGKPIQERKIVNGWFKNPKTGERIDEGMLVYYKKPRSYTCEDMLELFTHGNPLLMNELVTLCLNEGARLAEHGEYTFRAFINGRLDLLQAEAINELVNADSIYHARSALKNLEGKFSKFLKTTKEALLSLIAELEAEINFSETDELELTNSHSVQLDKIISSIRKCLARHNENRFISGGYTIAIVGKANAGKSSLFNILLNKSRAIITDIAGTTRDYLAEKIMIQNFPVTLIDTAGIRTPKSRIEQLGIEKTKDVVNKSDAIIMIFDGSRRWNDQDEQIVSLWHNKAIMAIINKHDLVQRLQERKITSMLETENIPVIRTSLVTKYGVKKVWQCLQEKVEALLMNYRDEDILINARQYGTLRRCLKELEKAKREIQAGVSPEYVVLSLDEARKQLDQLTGASSAEDILDIIFSKFCIGK